MIKLWVYTAHAFKEGIGTSTLSLNMSRKGNVLIKKTMNDN